MSESRRDPEAVLRRLEWTVLRRLDGVLCGDYRTLFRGFGMDLADLREYQVNDDVRHIDWNVTARLQTPYVREFQEDREVTAWFLVDVSPSVDFGSAGAKKRAVLVDFVAALARILTRRGNRVGVMCFSGGVDATIPPRGGRRQVVHIVNTILARPELREAEPTNLEAFLKAASHVIRRRSLVFVVSDFISEPGWEKSLSRLAHRHEILAVRLVDPLERALPDLGLVVMQDAETGEQLLVDSSDRKFRLRFAAAARRREEALRAAFGEAGVDALELSTDGDLVDAILRFSDLRGHRSRSRAAAPVPTHLDASP